MTGFEHWLAEATPWLHRYGYAALALALFVEGAGIPAPGSLLMGGAAILAGRGEMGLIPVLLTAWPAAVAGDNAGYWIGRSGGRRLLLRAGLSRQRLARFDGFFRRFGVWLVLLGRFFDGTRQLDGLVAGSARMPWPKFFLADLIGSGVWVAFWVFGLYTLDRHATAAHRLLDAINPWVAVASLALFAAMIFWLLRRRSEPTDNKVVQS
ncbi:MAG: DedA family protein [Chromatiales bacterium]|nr:DedA family protein [Chromatiales bacterium]